MKTLIPQLCWGEWDKYGVKDNNKKLPMLERERYRKPILKQGGGLFGQSKYITCTLEMSVPYSIHPKVSEEGIVWEIEK